MSIPVTIIEWRVGIFIVLALLALGVLSSPAAEVPAGTPDPLLFDDGTRVTKPEQWLERRRPELLTLFHREMYGQAPGRPPGMKFEVFDEDSKALQGRATRRQIAVYFNGQTNGPRMDVLLYLPNNMARPVPTFLTLNFWGNHAVIADPAIRITQNWMESNRNPWVDLSGVTNGVATEACRGINARQWPIETILERGYGFATIYRGDIAPDKFDGFTNSLHALYPELQGRGDNFTTIGAWAWGLSRAMDYLVTDPRVDAQRVAVFGWSRLGKTALWAAATDERFALAISHESGAGGAKLFRHGVGETIERLNTVFPHWFCGNFRKYNGRDREMPFDQHMLISLIAPRPVYVASAEEDLHADPAGEFLSAQLASPVFELFHNEGLPAKVPPLVSQPVFGRIGYHVRPGKHDVLPFDWEQYLTFADMHLKPRPAPEKRVGLQRIAP